MCDAVDMRILPFFQSLETIIACVPYIIDLTRAHPHIQAHYIWHDGMLILHSFRPCNFPPHIPYIENMYVTHICNRDAEQWSATIKNGLRVYSETQGKSFWFLWIYIMLLKVCKIICKYVYQWYAHHQYHLILIICNLSIYAGETEQKRKDEGKYVYLCKCAGKCLNVRAKQTNVEASKWVSEWYKCKNKV